jgi:hypothetical protein
VRASSIFGVIGALVVIISTDVSWYSHDAVAAGPPGTTLILINASYTLWAITTVAPVLLIIAATFGAVALLVPASLTRAGGIVAAVAGAGITVYCLVRMFDFPNIGPHIPGVAGTVLDAGPFIGFTGGALIIVGAVGLLLGEAPERVPEARPATATPAGTPA